MLNVQWPFRWTRWVVALTGLLSSSALAYAQGCAMCYTSAAAQKPQPRVQRSPRIMNVAAPR